MKILIYILLLGSLSANAQTFGDLPYYLIKKSITNPSQEAYYRAVFRYTRKSTLEKTYKVIAAYDLHIVQQPCCNYLKDTLWAIDCQDFDNWRCSTPYAIVNKYESASNLLHLVNVVVYDNHSAELLLYWDSFDEYYRGNKDSIEISYYHLDSSSNYHALRKGMVYVPKISRRHARMKMEHAKEFIEVHKFSVSVKKTQPNQPFPFPTAKLGMTRKYRWKFCKNQ